MPGGFVMLILMPIVGRLTGIIQPKYLIALGMLLTAYGLYYMTSFSPGSDFGFFAWARSLQMLGAPFLFIPITTISYAGLPAEKTNEAAALINVARNEGGSIGVSLVTTMLAQRAQFHQSRLVEHVTPTSPQLQAMLRQGSQHFTATGASSVDAQHQTLGFVGQLVQTQSQLLSYIDVYFVLAVIAALMIPVALLLRPIERESHHSTG
jgi:DHA2 family multidrug resistance protein